MHLVYLTFPIRGSLRHELRRVDGRLLQLRIWSAFFIDDLSAKLDFNQLNCSDFPT